VCQLKLFHRRGSPQSAVVDFVAATTSNIHKLQQVSTHVIPFPTDMGEGNHCGEKSRMHVTVSPFWNLRPQSRSVNNMTKNFWVKRIGVLVVIAVFLAVSSAAIAGTIMNGKEVKPYTGHIVSHNERTSEIVVKTENSTGHWKLSHHTVVLFGKERLNFSEIWRKTKKVEVFVSKDGEVQRISVLEWK
jgi:hypothetical protein